MKQKDKIGQELNERLVLWRLYMLGTKRLKNVKDTTRLFCQEMQMTPEQRNRFEELIKEIVRYSLDTSTDCANAVGGKRQIKNNIDET